IFRAYQLAREALRRRRGRRRSRARAPRRHPDLAALLAGRRRARLREPRRAADGGASRARGTTRAAPARPTSCAPTPSWPWRRSCRGCIARTRARCGAWASRCPSRARTTLAGAGRGGVPGRARVRRPVRRREPVMGHLLTRRGGWLDWRAMRARAAAALEALEVAIDLDAPLGALSVARKHRVSIARALTHDARVLILD